MPQGHRHGQPGQHVSGPDQAGRGRTSRASRTSYYPNGCKRNYTRVIPTDDLQGGAGAQWASQLGAKKVYVLDDTEVYGKGIADVLSATKLGIEVVSVIGRDGIDGKATDYKALAEKIKAAGPGPRLLRRITQNNAGQLWRDLRDAMPDVS